MGSNPAAPTKVESRLFLVRFWGRRLLYLALPDCKVAGQKRAGEALSGHAQSGPMILNEWNIQ
ncbi:MAG: hypothetical protein CMI60_18820 [Parvibaculum sp.]|nr:hypothetical protein [Parvibaculum sp.]